MTTIDEICLFVAMRGLWDKPDPDVLKLWDWLREEFDLKVEENH